MIPSATRLHSISEAPKRHFVCEFLPLPRERVLTAYNTTLARPANGRPPRFQKSRPGKRSETTDGGPGCAFPVASALGDDREWSPWVPEGNRESPFPSPQVHIEPTPTALRHCTPQFALGKALFGSQPASWVSVAVLAFGLAELLAVFAPYI